MVRRPSWRPPLARLLVRRSQAAPDGLDDPAVQALFEAGHYASASGVGPGRSGLAHYLAAGWRLGLDPHPLFATRYYLAHSRDVAGVDMCPLVHYARHGAFELRSPHPLFDSEHYAQGGGETWDATVDPLLHYLSHEGRDGREPNAWFDSEFYRRHSPDVVAAGVNPLVHYASVGWRQGRPPHPDFDVQHYLRTNPDVADAGAEPLAHFLRFGIRQGRAPSPHIDPVVLAMHGTGTDHAPERRPADSLKSSRSPTALSVVVGTVGDTATLPAVLTALEGQTARRADFEVVVVAEAAGESLTRWADGALRRLVVHPGSGVAGRRNLGLFLSESPLVLFLADDEVADPDLVTEHRRAHVRFPQVEMAVVGRTTWAGDAASSPLAGWTTMADDVPLGYPGNPRSIAPDVVHVRARQLSVKRSFLVRRGVFDPSFDRFHDVELGIRLQLAGIDLRSWPHARSSRLGPCDLDAMCDELADDGPELVRLASADPSGLVRALCAVDGAAGMWQRATGTFAADRAAARDAEADVVARPGEDRELFRRYHDLLWASRARGIADALAAPDAPAAPGRPEILAAAHLPPARMSIRPERRPRVLVAGVVLADRPNTAAATAAELAASEYFDVDQHWVVIGRARRRHEPSPSLPDRYVAERRAALAPKYEVLGTLLAGAAPATYDYVLLVDDDVDLPDGFLDAFVDIQQSLGFVLAQPARSAGSPADHPIVLQQPGSLARRTLFVEQGPVLSIAREALEAILPFDLRSPMGWGYESIWSHRLGDEAAIGIIDATPVAHRLRPTAAFYSKSDGETRSATLLAAVAHRPLDECMRILEVHPLELGGVGRRSAAGPAVDRGRSWRERTFEASATTPPRRDG